jgi:hypothetical protein
MLFGSSAGGAQSTSAGVPEDASLRAAEGLVGKALFLREFYVSFL